MSCPPVFKRYESTARLRQAVRNHRLLVATGLPVPRLIAVQPENGMLGFERIVGRHALDISDLERVSAQLGRWHWQLAKERHAGDRGSLLRQKIKPFLPARAKLLRTLQAPGMLVDGSQAGAVGALAERCPPSIYKDVNVRNVLVGATQIYHVDFDDLSLAPAGYDLAKLLVSWAMTHVPRPPVETLLTSYNRAAGGELCGPGVLAVWIEVHHVLTSRYVGRGSYRYQWAAVRTAEDERRALAALAS